MIHCIRKIQIISWTFTCLAFTYKVGQSLALNLSLLSHAILPFTKKRPPLPPPKKLQNFSINNVLLQCSLFHKPWCERMETLTFSFLDSSDQIVLMWAMDTPMSTSSGKESPFMPREYLPPCQTKGHLSQCYAKQVNCCPSGCALGMEEMLAACVPFSSHTPLKGCSFKRGKNRGYIAATESLPKGDITDPGLKGSKPPSLYSSLYRVPPL